MQDRSKGPEPQPESHSGPKLVTVDKESATRRLDNFVMGELRGLPRTRIYRMIRTGEVRVNKGRAKPAYRLAEGDVVRIPPAHGVITGDKHQLSAAKVNWILGHISYEDAWFMLLNKPSGLAVHGGSGINLGAIELMRVARPDNRYMELVHRLDRDTSGCLLIAKKRSSLRTLHAALREGRVRKIYRALLTGRWSGGMREVALPLVTEHRRGGERHVRPGEEGKPALTRFYPEQVYSNATLVRVELLTGRTHQIRVHAAAIGHPVAGDTRYGVDDDAAARVQKNQPGGLQRLFLHASELAFDHPDDGRRMNFSLPLDPVLQAVLARLEKNAG